MNQMFFQQKLLFLLFVPGLAFSFQPFKAMETKLLDDPAIEIAQASSDLQKLSSELGTFKEKANLLKDSINQLNSDLVLVYEKEIDSSEINLELSKKQLKEAKESWQSWKNNLENNSQKNAFDDFVNNIDSNLNGLENVLLPLKQEIIQSTEQFKNREVIPQLKDYQELLFGATAQDSDVDGLFGKGTQGKIAQTLKGYLGNIDDNIEKIELEISQNSSRIRPHSNEENQDLQKQLQQLESRINQLSEQLSESNQEIERLRNEIKSLSTDNNPTQTPEEETVVRDNAYDQTSLQPTNPTEETKDNNIFVMFIFLAIIGGISIYAIRQLDFLRKTKKDLSKTLNQEDKELNGFTQEDTLTKSNMSESNYSYQDYDNTGYNHTNLDIKQTTQEGQNWEAEGSVPIMTELNPIPPYTQAEEKVIKPDLDYIKSEADLLPVYNNNYKALLRQIVIMTATEESIEKKREGYDYPIIFSESNNGNYWLTLMPQFESPHYCLVPKRNLIINEHNYEAVRYIFNCIGYENRTSNKFIVRQTAIVYWEDKEKNCYLCEPGELIFS
ncbi:hypothetical protein [Crocosphaera sp. Alani8]|uniref:hypothetical protein n=1 Tax=Crocosphaera sp. Alani8 TaxID=3038952 RepID=UPI00313B1A49